MDKKMPEMTMQQDGDDFFVLLNGTRIAVRGKFDTPQAKTWVSIRPGYTVTDNASRTEIDVQYRDGADLWAGLPSNGEI